MRINEITIKINLKTIIESLAVLLIILNSRTYYFSILNGNFYKIILMLVCVFLLVSFVKNFDIRIWIKIGIIIFILGFIDIIHSSYWQNVNVIVTPLILSGVVIQAIGTDKFIKNYVNIMTIISVISIICFAVANLVPSIAFQVMNRYITGDYSSIMLSPFYFWGSNNIFMQRNSGPWWEPGAYQIFIMLALLFLLTNDNLFEKTSKVNRRKLFILLITLLTTMSTTAYLELILLIVFFNNNLMEFFKNKFAKSVTLDKQIIGIALLIVILIALSTSGVIGNKFSVSSDNYISYETRLADLKVSLNLFISNFWSGMGMDLAGSLSTINQYDFTTNSNGLLIMCYTFGVVFCIIYFFLLFRGVKSYIPTDSIIKTVIVGVIFLCFFLTENIYYFPVITILLLGMRKKKKINNVKG